MLILIALEPLLYSEAIGDAIRERKPHLDVEIVEPDALGPEVARLVPKLVLCSQAGPDRIPEGLAWIEYRPYDHAGVTLRAGGQRFELEVVNLADLLSVVDRAEELVRST